jgi:hypothetical protein
MTLKPTAVLLDWADGKYTFDLGPIGALRIHDDAVKMGPGHVLRRLMTGESRYAEVRETIRCALIGGGTEPREALRLTELYVDGLPYRPNILVAIEVLSRFLDGAPEDAVEENPPEAPETGQDGSTSESSTALDTSSDSAPGKST